MYYIDSQGRTIRAADGKEIIPTHEGKGAADWERVVAHVQANGPLPQQPAPASADSTRVMPATDIPSPVPTEPPKRSRPR